MGTFLLLRWARPQSCQRSWYDSDTRCIRGRWRTSVWRYGHRRRVNGGSREDDIMEDEPDGLSWGMVFICLNCSDFCDEKIRLKWKSFGFVTNCFSRSASMKWGQSCSLRSTTYIQQFIFKSAIAGQSCYSGRDMWWSLFIVLLF